MLNDLIVCPGKRIERQTVDIKLNYNSYPVTFYWRGGSGG